jgi:hypothetical protein
MSPNYESIFDSSKPTKTMFTGTDGIYDGSYRGNYQFIFRGNHKDPLFQSFTSFVTEGNDELITGKVVSRNYSRHQKLQLKQAIQSLKGLYSRLLISEASAH